MRHWLATVSAEQFADERLYARDVVVVPAGVAATAEVGDPVALVAAVGPAARAVLFGHGRVRSWDEATNEVLVAYRWRIFDEPAPVPEEIGAGHVTPGLRPLEPGQFTRLAALGGALGSVQAGAGHPVWFVSVALPIEAASRAEAVREFWTYLEKLGPRELPAYVWPLGDELAMQAFVLGVVANLDPEEDGED